MNSVDPSTLRDVCIILLSLVGVVCLIINTIHGTKRKPAVDVDLSTVSTRLEHIEEMIRGKQDQTICEHLHTTLNSTLKEIKIRHENFEKKISLQIGGVHESIKAVFGEVRELCGKVEAYQEKKQ